MTIKGVTSYKPERDNWYWKFKDKGFKLIQKQNERRRYHQYLRKAERGWNHEHIDFVSNAAIRIAHSVALTAKADPNMAIFAAGRKGLMAERIIQAACNEMGIRLPKPFCMKAKPSTATHTEIWQFGGRAYAPTVQGKEYEATFERGAQMLAEFIKGKPIYEELRKRKNIVVVEEFSAQKSQSYYFKRALEIAAPKAKVQLFILLEGLPERQFPVSVRPETGMSARQRSTLKHSFGKEYIEEESFLISDMLGDVYFKTYISDIRKAIREKLAQSK